jgi:CopG family nickel-responsive transcriptional regulator
MAHAKKELSTRITASISPELAAQFDELVAETPHKNRSFELAAMIQNRLIEEAATKETGEVIGTLTLMFDHHKHQVQETLTSVQHDHQLNIIATLHVHIDHHHCLEVLVVRGNGSEIESLAKKLLGVKGVKHGKLTVSAVAAMSSHPHGPSHGHA